MNKTYMDKVHTWGRIWCIASLIFFLCIPVAICLHLGVWPRAEIVEQIQLNYEFLRRFVDVDEYTQVKAYIN